MKLVSARNDAPPTQVGGWANTVWTVVLSASRQDENAAAALNQLCSTYRPAIYGFLLRRYKPEKAEDLTQGFFAHILDKNRLGTVDPAAGKFRSWLLECLKRFLCNEWDKEQTIKRGGGDQPVSLPPSEDDTGFLPIADPSKNPEEIFRKEWAKQLISCVFKLLGEQCRRDGKHEQFKVLLPFLNGAAVHGDHAGAAKSLGISEGAARVDTTRLRKEFNRLLRAEIAKTVPASAEIDEEIRFLKAALRGS